MPPNGENDDSVASLEGFGRYSSIKQGAAPAEEKSALESVKESSVNLAKVHSRPVDKRDIEIEFKDPSQNDVREEENRREIADANRDENAETEIQQHEQSEQPAPIVLESNLSVDDTLFDSTHTFAMTQVPTKTSTEDEPSPNPPKLSPLLPVKRIPSTSTAQKSVGDTTASVVSVKPQTPQAIGGGAASVVSIQSQRSQRSKAAVDATASVVSMKSQKSHKTKASVGTASKATTMADQKSVLSDGNSSMDRSRSGALFASSEKELENASNSGPADLGVVWVRTHSSSKGGSVFFGKTRNRIVPSVESIDEDREMVFSPSMMSDASNDTHGKPPTGKLSKKIDSDRKLLRPADGSSLLSGDSQERYAKAKANFMRSQNQSKKQTQKDKDLLNPVDGISMLSGDSQERYAKTRSPSNISKKSHRNSADSKLLNPMDGISMLSGDSQERYAKTRLPSHLSRKSHINSADNKLLNPTDGLSMLSGDTQEKYAKSRSNLSQADSNLLKPVDGISSQERYAKGRSPSHLSRASKKITFDTDRDLMKPVDGLSLLSGDTQEKYAKSRSRSNLSQTDRYLMKPVDGISMLSGDSQERYAKGRSRSNLSKDSLLATDKELLKPVDHNTFMSADSQELYALRAMQKMPKADRPYPKVGPKTLYAASGPSSDDNDLSSKAFNLDDGSMMSGNEDRTLMSHGDSTFATNMDHDTMYTNDQSHGSSGKNIFAQLYDGAREELNLARNEHAENYSGSESDDSEDSGDFDGSVDQGTFDDTMGGTFASLGSGESEEDSEYGDESIDDVGTYFGASINGEEKSVKTNVSDVSGSFDDDEVLGQMKTNADTEKGPANLEDAKKILKQDKIVKPKPKKKIFKFATGLGRNKVTKKTVDAPAQANTVKKEKKLLTKKKKKKITNLTKMKKTAIRAPKKKKIKKKSRAQLRTIRINGQTDQDDIVPRKGEPGAKVMRVCKLTSQGYVAAEFTSIDPNNTPLHIACLTHYPSKFILEHLLKSDTDMAIATENSSGELPIHYAVMDKKGVDPQIFDALIDKFPESIEHRNIDDSLPIHVACQVGAPSFYSIKKLLEIFPSSVMLQNDLQVPVDDEIEEDDDNERGFLAGCGLGFCMDWFKQDDGPRYLGYETGWTPLHLAVVNGAPPEVIEAIIETNPECMNVTTNKKRTAYECAVGVIINAILNDVPMYKVQNTYNAIEIMQSYDKEFIKKDELALKAGIVNSALESTESYGEMWMTIAEKLPPGDQIEQMLTGKKAVEEPDDDEEEDEEDWQHEKGMTDLHRAVLKRVEPEDIQTLLEESPECMDIVSTADRTPFECAKDLLIRGLLKKTPMSRLTNTFVTLEAMQAYRESQGEEVPEDFDATMALSKADVSHYGCAPRKEFGSRSDNYQYMKTFGEMNLKGRSLLGQMVVADNDSAVQPYEYYPPANLAHVNLRVNVPAGYRRLRRAFLSADSPFVSIAVYHERCKYRKMKAIPWNKCGQSIGKIKLDRKEKWSNFIGAEKTMQYICPGTDEVGPTHVAYERMELVEYNDFCFAVKSVVKTPDLPYGSEYETAFQILFIDKGINNCRLICSSEVVVTGMALDDDWQVRNAMRHRATDYFYAVADAICMHSGDAIDPNKSEDEEIMLDDEESNYSY